MEHVWNLLFLGLVGGVFSLIGGLALIACGKRILSISMTPLISFAAGAFLSVAFLDLLPEAVEVVEFPEYIFMALLAGIALFFILERFLMKYVQRHSTDEHHADHTESLPLLVIAGDAFHNFLDGVVIFLAYTTNPAAGFATAIAVAAHEIPQEIGDFAILLDRGWSKLRVVLINIAQSLMTLVGIGVGALALTWFEWGLPYLLAGTAGVFAYIALSDLIPEMHHRAKHHHFFRIVGSFLIGLVLVGLLISRMHGE